MFFFLISYQFINWQVQYAYTWIVYLNFDSTDSPRKPPDHDGFQRSHHTFHIVTWQSHHTFTTFIYKSSKSIPFPPFPNFQFPWRFVVFQHLISLPTTFYVKQNLNSTWLHRWLTATFGTRWGPATPQRTIQQVIKQMGRIHSIRRKMSIKDTLFGNFVKKKKL